MSKFETVKIGLSTAQEKPLLWHANVNVIEPLSALIRLDRWGKKMSALGKQILPAY